MNNATRHQHPISLLALISLFLVFSNNRLTQNFTTTVSMSQQHQEQHQQQQQQQPQQQQHQQQQVESMLQPPPPAMPALTEESLQMTTTSDEMNPSIEPLQPIPPTNNIHQPKPTLYGHLHMAKTAGTTLNGLMATKYNRICGNKGFTNELRAWYIIDNGIFESTNYATDCDWISPELPHEFWNVLDHVDREVEMHVPCRDPIAHLMSVVNHEKRVFNCNAPNLRAELRPFVLYVKGRFDYDILSSKSNFALKCFDYSKYEEYVTFMGQFLTPFVATTAEEEKTAEYIFRPTNKPRSRENECIWKNEALMGEVKNYLIENFDYYNYCHRCIGTQDDLFVGM